MPTTYYRNWHGPKPGLSKFVLDDKKEEAMVDIERQIMQYFIGAEGPHLENLAQYGGDGTYIQFLRLHTDLYDKISKKFSAALRAYTGDPFDLNLGTQVVTIGQERMKDIIKGAFPGIGASSVQPTVANRDDIITFWVLDALCCRKVTESRTRQLLKNPLNRKKQKRDVEKRTAGYIPPFQLTAVDLESEVTEDAEAAVSPPSRLIDDEGSAPRQDSSTLLNQATVDASNGASAQGASRVSHKSARELAFAKIFGDYSKGLAHRYTILLVADTEKQADLLSHFSWVPNNSESSLDQNALHFYFSDLDINVIIYCVRPDVLPRALTMPRSLYGLFLYDGAESTRSPLPNYLPMLRRLTTKDLDVEQDGGIFRDLLSQAPISGHRICRDMQNKFREARLECEQRLSHLEGLIFGLDQNVNRSLPPAPQKEFAEDKPSSDNTTGAKSAAANDLACRVMRCREVCIPDCDTLAKDSEGFFYYQMPGSQTRHSSCPSCKCSLSLHKIQSRSVTNANRPFAQVIAAPLGLQTDGATTRLKEEALMREENYRRKLETWHKNMDSRQKDTAKAETELTTARQEQQALSTQLADIVSCLARWTEAIKLIDQQATEAPSSKRT